jgi:hypothetical protein
MSKFSWATLGNINRGLAVEGKHDKRALETFLDAGERQKLWEDWRKLIAIQAVGGVSKVIDEARSDDPRIWGLIDRDWRSDSEIATLRADKPRLLILPRVMIENHCINPDELELMLPPSKRGQLANIKQEIEAALDGWVQHGALWKTFVELGAFEFCRGHERGYPMALLSSPMVAETDIASQFQAWHSRLEPAGLWQHYEEKRAEFQADRTRHFTQHVHGKMFFGQVVQQALNHHLGQRSESDWLETLFDGENTDIMCPPDLIPVLKQVLRNPLSI